MVMSVYHNNCLVLDFFLRCFIKLPHLFPHQKSHQRILSSITTLVISALDNWIFPLCNLPLLALWRWVYCRAVCGCCVEKPSPCTGLQTSWSFWDFSSFAWVLWAWSEVTTSSLDSILPFTHNLYKQEAAWINIVLIKMPLIMRPIESLKREKNIQVWVGSVNLRATHPPHLTVEKI